MCSASRFRMEYRMHIAGTLLLRLANIGVIREHKLLERSEIANAVCVPVFYCPAKENPSWRLLVCYHVKDRTAYERCGVTPSNFRCQGTGVSPIACRAFPSALCFRVSSTQALRCRSPAPSPLASSFDPRTAKKVLGDAWRSLSKGIEISRPLATC